MAQKPMLQAEENRRACYAQKKCAGKTRQSKSITSCSRSAGSGSKKYIIF
jgi:hypothetical protein